MQRFQTMENMQVLQKGMEILPQSNLAFMSSFKFINGIQRANKYWKEKAKYSYISRKHRTNKNSTVTFS